MGSRLPFEDVIRIWETGSGHNRKWTPEVPDISDILSQKRIQPKPLDGKDKTGSSRPEVPTLKPEVSLTSSGNVNKTLNNGRGQNRNQLPDVTGSDGQRGSETTQSRVK